MHKFMNFKCSSHIHVLAVAGRNAGRDGGRKSTAKSAACPERCFAVKYRKSQPTVIAVSVIPVGYPEFSVGDKTHFAAVATNGPSLTP